MKATPPERLELNVRELDAFLERMRATLNDADYALLEKLVKSHAYVSHLVETQGTTIRDLRRLFGVPTEKTSKVLDNAAGAGTGAKESAGGSTPPPNPDGKQDDAAKDRRPGHGRNGADAYRGGQTVAVPHAALRPQQRCPDCGRGKLYALQPAVIVRIVGQAPLQAKVYELDRLRCNLCGEVFTAQPPEQVGTAKYDATAASMIALLRYGSGMPFKRLEGLQGSAGIPLPASTQWDIVEDAAEQLVPVYQELMQQAAQGEVLHNDDTSMTVLELTPKRRSELFAEDGAREHSPDRTGVFTSGIVSTRKGRKISLFFTGCKHAGENIADLLRHRVADLNQPIQMCDGLPHNLPKDLEVILANCLAHGRRYFVREHANFPDECRHVLEELAEVYRNDAVTRQQNMSPQERLRYHQATSGPVLDRLQAWFNEQFQERRVEPNSSLGKAISYMRNHWEALTLFLREAGAPLDNNLCERALKKAIRHRNNSLFYKTRRGAAVGDLFMSLIHTCQLNDVDPFDYLTELLRNRQALSAAPPDWMPWTYRDALQGAAQPAD